MAFFTRLNSSIPVLPLEDLGNDSNACSMATQACTHRKYASEPVTTFDQSIYNIVNSGGPNSIPSETFSSSSTSKSSGVTSGESTNAMSVTISVSVDDDDAAATTKVSNRSVNAKGRPTETDAPSLETDKDDTPESTEKNNGNEEPKRYEYVVDRVLGVEV